MRGSVPFRRKVLITGPGGKLPLMNKVKQECPYIIYAGIKRILTFDKDMERFYRTCRDRLFSDSVVVPPGVARKLPAGRSVPVQIPELQVVQCHHFNTLDCRVTDWIS